jgi:hypothetical protein
MAAYAPQAQVRLPELPRAYVDTTYIPVAGKTIYVPQGGDLQAALDDAQPGDVVTLQAGATYTGNFVLPAKAGASHPAGTGGTKPPGWITIRGDAPDAALPARGRRAQPTDAAAFPKLLSPNAAPALRTAPGAQYFRIVGIEFGLAPGVTASYGLVSFGDGSRAQASLARVPHHLILERVYIHGNTHAALRRGVALNSAWSAVIDSYIADVHEQGADSQAIAGWNGPGPFKIANNELQAAGENVIFGGADPAIPGLVPADIEVRGNHFFKPLSWRAGDPSYAGRPWTVKNLFELKNARRVLVEGNLFENNWAQAQNGFAVLFTVRNQGGGAPWSAVEDVTFRLNHLRHSGSAVNVLGMDDRYPSQRVQRILIRNNLFEDVDGARWGGPGRLFQVLGGPADLAIEHNTAFHSGDIISASGEPAARFVFRDNLVFQNMYGVGGDGTYGDPLATLTRYFPGGLFSGNILVGAAAPAYPPGNFFPGDAQQVRFENLAGGDYRLAADSPYRGRASDGSDPGADIVALRAALAGKTGPPAPAGCPHRLPR